MKIKLIDVAKAAGVSVSTVSRVINGDRERPASSETTDKIWAIVKELGYVPNKNAKNLVKGEVDNELAIGRIGCIYTSTYDLNNDPFFSCIGIGVQIELNHQNYNLAYSVSAAMMDYKALYSYIVNHTVDGVIILGRFEESILDMIKGHFNHIVYAGINPVEAGFDQVICDGYEGAKAAINHLIDSGHKHIGYVGYIGERDLDKMSINELRYKAYCDLMKEKDLPIDENNIMHTKLRTTAAYQEMMTYLHKTNKNEVPSAFYCANDATAFGVMKALQDEGYVVPKDVAIIGLDNVEMASFSTPRLSSIGIPRRALGSRAVKTLIEQIETKRDYPVRINLPFELIVRESSNYRYDLEK
ncbi:MAG: LacI family DNA-binding transcriptional regulator [Vallitaleaceae bacterium]|jgi:DNA-binding LacI/PurR family transcriptional regulator|nr:LacI family DNA-binding transcriptional regulator [Vallitaleaceae bacterium]